MNTTCQKIIIVVKPKVNPLNYLVVYAPSTISSSIAVSLALYHFLMGIASKSSLRNLALQHIFLNGHHSMHDYDGLHDFTPTCPTRHPTY